MERSRRTPSRPAHRLPLDVTWDLTSYPGKSSKADRRASISAAVLTSTQRSQELYYSCLQSQILPLCLITQANEEDASHCRQLLKLGQTLAVDVSAIWHKLE